MQRLQKFGILCRYLEVEFLTFGSMWRKAPSNPGLWWQTTRRYFIPRQSGRPTTGRDRAWTDGRATAQADCRSTWSVQSRGDRRNGIPTGMRITWQSRGIGTRMYELYRVGQKSKLSILSECVNKTDNLRGMWTNTNIYGENCPLSKK